MSGDAARRRTQERLQALRASFKTQLGDLVQQLQEEWHALKGHEPAQLQSLYARVHRITGSAGSFGFRGVSEAAAPLEVLLGNLQTAPQVSPGVELRAQVERYLEQLLASWQQVQAEDSAEQGDHPPDSAAYGVDPALVLALGPSEAVTSLRHQLEPFGYRLCCATQASELLTLAQQESPGAVLWLAPLENLAEWTQALHPTPVIVVNAQADIQHRLQAVRGGCCAYLPEPVNLADLLVFLQQAGGYLGRVDKPYRVLIVDDDEGLAESFKLVLQLAAISARVLTKPLQILEVLAEESPDLVLMDLHMPECNGFELVQVVRQHLKYRHIPIVFLSADHNQERQLKARLLGGDGFITKPVYSQQLVEIVKNQASRGRALRSAARRDGLTGLLNQSSFRERLGTELLRSARQSLRLSLALVDLDHFQAFNQQQGYWRGDQVIKTLAGMLTQRLRRTDIISRHGSGEFAVIFPDTPGRDAYRVMDGIRASFAGLDLSLPGAPPEFLTVSCGIADNVTGNDPTELMGRVRWALRAAKAGGRNRVMDFLPDPAVKGACISDSNHPGEAPP